MTLSSSFLQPGGDTSSPVSTSTKTLKLFATLRDIAKAKTIDVPFREGQTVRELVEAISAAYPELGEAIITPEGELTGLVHILVHGRNIDWLEGLETRIKASDILVLMPPSAGG